MKDMAAESIPPARTAAKAASRAASSRGGDHLASGTDPFVHLDHRLVEHLGQLDVELEQVGAGLVADHQRILEPLGGHQHGRLSPALQQGIGGHGGSHLHGFDGGVDAGLFEQPPDPLDGGVGVVAGIVGQEFAYQHLSAGGAGHHIREGAASVYPELPTGGGRRRLLGAHERSS